METGKGKRKTLKFETISNYSPVEKKLLNGIWHWLALSPAVRRII